MCKYVGVASSSSQEDSQEVKNTVNTLSVQMYYY